MRVIFICQALDETDPIQASTVKWVTTLASKSQVEKVAVLTLRKGQCLLPKNTIVHSFKGENKITTLISFYTRILALMRSRFECFLVYQGGPYPALLLPFKILMRKPIYQWKAHPHISPLMQFCARYCNTKIFTSTPRAFPLSLAHIKVVGQGVDIARFCVKPAEKTGDLVTVGRIAPVKRLDRVLRTVAECRTRFRTAYRLDIYGPTFDQDRTYREHLADLIATLQLSTHVSLHDPVPHQELPDLLNRYRLFLNFSETALDRAAVEAMACGLPIVSSNSCVKDVLPQELWPLLFVSGEDLSAQADRIHRLLSQKPATLAEVGQTLREIVLRNHSIDTLVDTILREMTPC